MKDLLPRGMDVSKKQTVVIAGDDQGYIVSASHVYALEREFPGIDIRRADSFDDIVDPDGPAMALILVEPKLVDTLHLAKVEIARRHPRATVALLQDDRIGVTPETVRQLPHDVSVLPMDLRLDLWLAAVRILLLGGGYYPPSLLRASLNANDAAQGANAPVPRTIETAPTAAAPPPSWGNLTQREDEILEMVSQGEPNKAIAAELGVSEHTVKLHVHKIIGKLGVRNRTEAAIAYLGQRSRQGDDPAKPAPRENRPT